MMTPTARQMIPASALAASAGIHLAVTREHLEKSLSHGAFFLVLAVAQAIWAYRVTRGVTLRERWLIGGAHLAVIGLWIVSRAAGLPGEPPEAAGAADIMATLAAVVIAATTLIGRPARTAAAWEPRASLATPVPQRRARRSVATPIATMTLLLSLSVGAAVGATPTDHQHGAVAAGRVAGSHGHDAAKPANGLGADIDGVHLHGLSSVQDPGAQPGRAADAPLDARLTNVGPMPTAIASGLDRIWVTDRQDGTLSELDLEGRVLRAVRIAEGPTDVIVAYGAVWVTDFSRDLLLRVDPETLRATPFSVGGGPTAVFAAADRLYVASISDGLVQAIEPASGRILATVPVGFGPTSISADRDRLYVVTTLDRTVVQIDLRTDEVIGAPLDVDAGAAGSIAAFGRLWVANSTAGVVDVIDARLGVVHPIRVDDLSGPGQGPVAVTESGGRIWVANNHDKTIRSIDPATYEVGAPLFFSNDLGRYPIAVQLVAQGGSLWVTDFQSGTVARIAAPA